MIVAFDLDDTLYPEMEYVLSGFRAVATHLTETHGLSDAESLSVMLRSLETSGRGSQFDDVLAHWGLLTKSHVRDLVNVYRSHDPQIELPSASRLTLETLTDLYPLYLVTDGNHRVQARKIEALGLEPYFKHCYLTNRYGRHNAKPSTHVFELMLRRERSHPSALVYVGDNPTKDFVGVRRLGGRTIRVLVGSHKDLVAAPGYEADVTVPDVRSVVDQISKLVDAS